ncbi:MAG: hypothetical protein COZ70_07380 [Deltaproteobacteria bacterium CG_4_8_14_3_um_filter_51_11]|nr:MAG: hypothetical protein COX16_15600 [Deltaproteobacteria bacterium CG23_combo_of_CG06-09_8_20_14_all_51_20]PIW01492.1 MAG: hypothetical protein COW41_02455 [Deltaproteobacteria bacterium CG17_big_fil_post_rev_8_21_14_2_50_51_6]PIX19729.1 MAG: hypothetical protein COZ70_07380 [Deltaproteobacteria bacterium CG_4_8_14_3_um_filter_51_11]PJB33516.1 MAG: hypothetical protein CO107_15520 [Deltaproteobacteria bacterium CG_4_9_14_3_um_filter_51_14]
MKNALQNFRSLLFVLALTPLISLMTPNAGYCDSDTALRKLHPDLRKIASQAGPKVQKEGVKTAASVEPLLVQVIAWVESNSEGKASEIDFARYFVDSKVFGRPPLKIGDRWLKVYFGKTTPQALIKIASVTQVSSLLPVVTERNAWPDNYPIEDPKEQPKKGPEDWAKLRETARTVSAQSVSFQEASETPMPKRLKSWFETGLDGPNKAKAAWDRGYQGEGVAVGVLDDGIDFAHPDLLGTHKIYSSTAAPQ